MKKEKEVLDTAVLAVVIIEIILLVGLFISILLLAKR